MQPGLIRRNISVLLALLSDAGAQREYESNVPIASVPSELCCMWFDDMYHPDDAAFQGAFSTEELAALARFSETYEAAVAEIQPPPDVVADMHAHPAWDRVLRAASVTLQALSAAGP